MKKILFGVATVAVAAVTAFAADREQFTVGELTVTKIISGGTEITATGAEVNRAADVSAGLRTVTATNGQAEQVSATDRVLFITASGSADTFTNTVSLTAAPGAVGQFVLLQAAGAMSNKIGLADSAPLYLTSAKAMDANDNLLLYVSATNVLIEVSTSAN